MAVRTLRYNSFALRNWKGATFATDRDALAFLEAAQIYNANQQRAIVNLVRSLKRVGLWSKMKAIYPFVGGTATSHKFNLKDPRDADAAFRLSFSGGWTHASTGALPNGTNAYADTFFIPSSQLSSSSAHLTVYNRSDTNNQATDFGSIGSGSNRFLIHARYDGTAYADCFNFNTNRISIIQSSSTGYYVVTRNSSTSLKLFRNNAQIGSTITSTSSGLSSVTLSMAIAAYNSSTGFAGFNNRECAFVTIGDGLTDTDATNLYNIVDLYQRRLGRNV